MEFSEFFLSKLRHERGYPELTIKDDALDLLIAYHWPGNVRELQNILERASIMCVDGQITANEIPYPVNSKSTANTDTSSSHNSASLDLMANLDQSLGMDEVVEIVESKMIRQALRKTPTSAEITAAPDPFMNSIARLSNTVNWTP